MITSRSNPRIKELASLKQAGERQARELGLAEGPRLVGEALGADTDVLTVVVAESALRRDDVTALLDLARQKAVEVLPVSDSCYERISDLRSPEGIAAVVRLPTIDPSRLLSGGARLLVACGVQDPGNGGALVRVAEAAGASGCIFCGGVDLRGGRYLRATAGSCFRLPCATTTVESLLQEMRRHRIRLLAAEAGVGSVDFTEADFAPPVAVAVGSEGGGLPEELRQHATQRVRIPMAGRVESLNVAVAAGILLYRAREAW